MAKPLVELPEVTERLLLTAQGTVPHPSMLLITYKSCPNYLNKIKKKHLFVSDLWLQLLHSFPPMPYINLL